ncbi:xanthine dehydrogenase accessory protein XdhC [Serratia rubidaea]|uniref:Xanthine dehydrogenase accessory protein XdhC n=1 Tax=Serratia rubidaea TaxID=61652 RepID=A0A4U9HGF3_SERRU|nr:xanthine dehydrogenase accessory protein XdhC [Serratia rubidaea]
MALFGAGHVGCALAQILATLPLQVRWLDSRAQQFPPQVAANITPQPCEDLPAAVDDMPPGCLYIVMTHDHGLDLALAERILKRNDAAYFGLIGSLTKRRRFEYQLGMRGVAPAALAQMRCPLGCRR